MADCIFCKIANGEIPSNKIYEDDEMTAFYDVAPQAPVHFLIIPRAHIRNIMEVQAEDSPLLGRLLLKGAELSKKLGCEEKGARFIVNCKEHGGQTVDHLHIHILAGRPLGWPPG
jgi:histidine triad (HIT) family protein